MRRVALFVLACAPIACGGRTDPGLLAAGAGALAGDGGPPSSCILADQLGRWCTTDTDCIVGLVTIDCCGNTIAIGINRTERARVDVLRSTCEQSSVPCGCPPGATRTDSGETALDAMSIQVACASAGPLRSCLTYVMKRSPPHAARL